MIDFVQGSVAAVESDSVIINVNGIGYKVYVAHPESFKPLLGQTEMLYTHHHMRDDWMGLYGFRDLDERLLFRLLISVSGIGPKVAMTIMQEANPLHILAAIQREDETPLMLLPGVGKKTAQRMIIDLKDRIKELNVVVTADGERTALTSVDYKKESGELSNALKGLGYQDYEINKILLALSEELATGESIDLLIRKSLKILMKG
jgi:Holliday junction DNA helicase RuvA